MAYDESLAARVKEILSEHSEYRRTQYVRRAAVHAGWEHGLLRD